MTITATKQIAPDEILTAEATLQTDVSSPYFSVTGQIATRRKRMIAGGCLHEEIAEHFPLAPLIALHLSDEQGVPMHAVENGLYWLGLTAYPDARNLEAFARHWRTDLATAEKIEAYVKADPNPREALRAIMQAEHLDRWRSEAEAGIALLTEGTS